jgi:hypothetical protein
MKLLRKFLCWIGVHELPPGVQHERSIVWACRNCATLVPGGATGSRRR